jgi:hypothetical protein
MILVIKLSLYMFLPMMAIIGRRQTLQRKCIAHILHACCLALVTLALKIVNIYLFKLITFSISLFLCWPSLAETYKGLILLLKTLSHLMEFNLNFFYDPLFFALYCFFCGFLFALSFVVLLLLLFVFVLTL